MYDFCSADLKKQLEGPRAALKEWEDEQVGRVRGLGGGQLGRPVGAAVCEARGAVFVAPLPFSVLCEACVHDGRAAVGAGLRE